MSRSAERSCSVRKVRPAQGGAPWWKKTVWMRLQPGRVLGPQVVDSLQQGPAFQDVGRAG